MPKLIPTPTQVAHAHRMAEEKIFLDRSEPGTGKTLTSLLAASFALKGLGDWRILIIVPTIVREQWYMAARDMFPEAWIQVIQNGRDFIHNSDGIVITIVTYGLAKQELMASNLFDWSPEIVILDEAHALKTRGAKVTKAIYGDDRVHGIIRDAMFVWPLTGTPIRRYPDDLYPMFRALFPEEIKKPNQRFVMSEREFTQEYCTTELRRYGNMRQAQLTVTGARNETKLAGIIECVSVKRRLSEMAAELPPVTYGTLNVPIDDDAVLQALKADAKNSGLVFPVNLAPTVPEEILKGLLAAGETHLATVRNVLARQKALSSDLFAYIRDLDEPVIVFAWHRAAMTQLWVLIANEKTLSIVDGSTSAKQRQEIADKFNAGEIDVLIGQMAAMGTGINLQEACHHVIMLEEDWSPAVNKQAIARVNRMGQKYPVHVDRVIADNFIDHAIRDTVRHKEEIMENLDV